ncbi:MAG: alkaline phosphatase family protein [Candidatus Heimdallarchaeota archaeon]
MMKKQNKIILSVAIIIVSVTSITLGILLPRSIDIPADSKLYIFNENENLAFVTVTSFTSLAGKSLEYALIPFLETYNITITNQLTIISSNGLSLNFLETELSNSNILLGENGFSVSINGIDYDFIQGLAIDIEYFSVDIATTIYETLNFSGWETEGSVIEFPNNTGFDKVILFHLDGFGWQFWNNLSTHGFIDLNITLLFNEPALTAYPPITNVATATMLSGFWPASTGITTRQNHILNVETIFDIASVNNFTTEIIEGNAGFIDISADFESWLPDINDSGTNDDEIFQRTIESINSSRSEILFTHFHGIDDEGHSYGPNSLEWLQKVEQIFDYLNEIIKYIEENTLVIFTADHGMHISDDPSDYRVGIHGDCFYDDMMVPIIFARK